jgi:hypothetical protein
MEGRIVSIHIASAAGAPMTAITTAHLAPGRSIEGDRFYASRGMDAASNGTTCDVTFIEQEALKGEKPRTDSDDTVRCNIVIHNFSLQQLIGRTFRIGDVVLRGLAPHEFCASEDTQQATSCMALHHADLRARILTEGTISVGDRIQGV